MPKFRVPLVGQPNQRNYDSLQTLISGKDQRFIGGILGVIQNPLMRGVRIYFEKRPGLETHLTPASSQYGEALFFSRTTNKYVTGFDSSGTTSMYVGTTLCGTF